MMAAPGLVAESEDHLFWYLSGRHRTELSTLISHSKAGSAVAALSQNCCSCRINFD